MATRAVRTALKGALVLCVFAAFWNGACSTTEPVPLPGIAVTPAAVTFNDTMGTAAPAPQTIAVAPEGKATLPGLSAAVDYGSGTAGWLTISLSDTVAPATVTVTSNLASLSAGTYQATVVISATDAANSPQLVPVTFELNPRVAAGMVLTPSTIAFADTTGNAVTATQAVTISRSDTGSLPLTGLTIGTATYVGPPGWLNASLSGTEAPATLTLSAKRAGLAAGTYSATLSLSLTCYDASAYDGISFWVKGNAAAGNSQIRFNVQTPVTEPVESGGVCTAGCYGHFGKVDDLDSITWERTDKAGALKRAVK